MHRFVASLVGSLAWVGAALAGPVVVWLEPEIPDARQVRRAEGMTGPVSHLAHVDLAFPPAPAAAADDAAYDALRAATVDARARWSGWDVERDLADTLAGALANITIVRSPRDLRDVVDAQLLLGAAASRAFPPAQFLTLEEAAPFRIDAPGGPVNRGWYDALALDPERPWARADIADGAPFEEFTEVQRRVGELPAGTVDLSGVPVGAQAFIDGVAIARGTASIQLRPGEHFFHIVRAGAISGRSRLVVESGREVPTPLVVDAEELTEARQRFLDDLAGSMPADARGAIDALHRANRGPVFLGAIEEGKVVVKPYRNAELLGTQLVTVVANGEIGFTSVASPLFDDANGEVVTAPGAHGGIGLEIGISHVAILGGFDAAFTPTETITYGNAEQTENSSTSVLPQPWAGLGVYLLRPSKPRTTLLLAGTYGFDGPAHMAVGGRLTLGLPIDDQGTWFRLTVGANRSGNVIESWRQAIPDETPMSVLLVRLGFASRF